VKIKQSPIFYVLHTASFFVLNQIWVQINMQSEKSRQSVYFILSMYISDLEKNIKRTKNYSHTFVLDVLVFIIRKHSSNMSSSSHSVTILSQQE